MSSPNGLPGVGCPGDTARRGKLKEKLTGGQGEDLGKEKTCCWVGACLHTEFAPGIKLISAGTSNSCPGRPKVRVPHYWDSDRGQSKCP